MLSRRGCIAEGWIGRVGRRGVGSGGEGGGRGLYLRGVVRVGELGVQEQLKILMHLARSE